MRPSRPVAVHCKRFGVPKDVAAGKKDAARLGAHVVFAGQSGFMMIASVHRTWAPVGQTPIVRHYYRRDRVSVIGGLWVSPKRWRLGLYFRR